MSAMNNDVAETLRRWFISMGYPLEDVADTDWNSLCCGRLPVFWKKTMRDVKSKQELNNIRRNILLREIKNFEKREESSATKLGYILPPSEIHYPKEQVKLSKKLATIQEELNNKMETLKKINDERKRKCFEMNEIKKDILNIESQIYSMKLVKQKLVDNTEDYNVIYETIQRFKNLFKDPNDNQQINEVEFREFQKQLATYSENKKEIISETILSNDSGLMSNSPNTTVICKDQNISEINPVFKKKETFELLNLINMHHKDIPHTIDKSVSTIQDAQTKEIESFVDSGELKTYKKGLLKMDLVHVQIIMETLRIKKDTKKARDAASLIKSKILKKLSEDNSKIQTFKHQCSLHTGYAYKKTISKELAELNAKVGFYSKFNNNVQINQIIACENPYLTLQNCKTNHMQIFSSCIQKLKDISSYITDLKVLNKNISKNVKQLSKITGSEKILWDSENDYLQDLYMKVVLNNPNAFRFEKENTFEALVHLQQIITEFNFNVRLQDTSNLISQELEYFKTYGNNSSRFLFERSKEQRKTLIQQFDESQLLLNYKNMEYLRPAKYFVLSLTRFYKFLSLLSKFTDLDCDSDTPKTIKYYLENNLAKLEETLLLKIDEHFPETSINVITKPLLNDFYNTNDFFIEYSKHKLPEKPEMF